MTDNTKSKPTNWNNVERGTPVLFRRTEGAAYEKATWFGGTAYYGALAGAFCWYLYYGSGALSRNVGARVAKNGEWYIDPYWCKLDDAKTLTKPPTKNKPKEVKMTLKLEVGKSYKNRRGDIVVITTKTHNHSYPFKGNDGESYTKQGSWSFSSITNSDLIEEIKPEPKKEPMTFDQLHDDLMSVITRAISSGISTEALYGALTAVETKARIALVKSFNRELEEAAKQQQKVQPAEDKSDVDIDSNHPLTEQQRADGWLPYAGDGKKPKGVRGRQYVSFIRRDGRVFYDTRVTCVQLCDMEFGASDCWNVGIKTKAPTDVIGYKVVKVKDLK